MSTLQSLTQSTLLLKEHGSISHTCRKWPFFKVIFLIHTIFFLCTINPFYYRSARHNCIELLEMNEMSTTFFICICCDLILGPSDTFSCGFNFTFSLMFFRTKTLLTLETTSLISVHSPRNVTKYSANGSYILVYFSSIIDKDNYTLSLQYHIHSVIMI